MVEEKIASRYVVRGDMIRPSTVRAGSEGDGFAKVTEVKLLGVFVSIETDAGVELLPVNRSITVWRASPQPPIT